jgi:glycogen debranching enzyme
MQTSVLDGSTFVVGDELGDLDAAPDRHHGFFRDDTRLVSRWRLTVGGARLERLSSGEVEHFAAEFFLVPRVPSFDDSPRTSVVRRRVVRGGSWIEEVGVLNHSAEPLELALRIEVDGDFADLFEVKDAAVRERAVEREADGAKLRLRHGRRELRIAASEGWEADAGGFSTRVEIGPQGEQWSRFEIGEPSRAGVSEARREMRAEIDQWLAGAPELDSEWPALRRAWERSLTDFAALRLPMESGFMPAAGLPWFMALFGRDSLIASYQALPVLPELARTTLIELARLQADGFDDFRESEPGKILHELRHGELTELGERPHSPYYGTADATPLFLVLLDEYVRWTGDAALARELEPNARRALAWIDEHGDLDGDGFVEYLCRNPATGLENQCWKDSPNAILFADGRRAEPPIASCEIQGYAYDAKRRCARLAAEVWGDAELAARLDREAAELRARFHDAFWVPEGDYYALALDRDKRRVDSLTSNVGHLLWSGIVDAERAGALAEHLLGERLFSGWGVRTMAAGDGGYNPVEYHNGTVWPHDCSLIAHGLAEYGRRDEAERIAVALVEAADHFDGRLPEVFAGYPRTLAERPVEYPTASRPQAWAAGAPLLLARTLGLIPQSDVWPGGQPARTEASRRHGGRDRHGFDRTDDAGAGA